jgi:DNA sulfur modification protein DndD
VSDLQLPLLVDTPLARLDAEHRHRLLHGYLPVVSNQVLLFATDAEADRPFLDEAQPYLAQGYRLKFDPTRGDTRATGIEEPLPFKSEYLSLQELPHAF